VQAALARRVDRAEAPGERAGDRRGQQAYDGGQREGEEAVGQVGRSDGGDPLGRWRESTLAGGFAASAA
jgi:hypothetical protein